MIEEKFKVLQFIRELIQRVDKELMNYPKREIEIKLRIRNSMFNLLELCYEANTAASITRKEELLERSIAKIKVIDFLLNLSYEKSLITSKKYLKLAEKLNDIVKYISGWLKKVKQDKNKIQKIKI